MRLLRRTTSAAAWALSIGFLISPASEAQPPSTPVPSFSYVASIKPNKAAEARSLSEYSPGGRFAATAITVASMLRIAYRTADYRIVGAPAWFSTDRYDIAAKVDDNPPPSVQVFLRTLLADRFHVVVRTQTRELPIFALVVARNDGRLGPQLVKTDFDCAAYAAAPHPLPDPARTPPCATRSRPGMLSGKSISPTQLAGSVSALVSRFTVDKTGLTGLFDVELTWVPEQTSSNAAASTTPDVAHQDSTGPSIVAAIQEQLGLKLVSERGPVDVLVVEHAEKPSDN
jgi:uncharacterized protein (TIGR03435 family)